MAGAGKDKPSVQTFADHEVIVPPHKLTKAVVPAGGDASYDPVARAEEALAALSDEFVGWMKIECDRLDAARRAVMAAGLNDRNRDELFRAAHDIKGEAATLGFPLAGEVCDSLCRLIEHTPEQARIPLRLVDQHVDAVRAIIREDARHDDKTAVALAARLRQVTDEFLAVENRHRPDYLDGILSPPLAPVGTTG